MITNINDFKLLAKKCEKYFDLMVKTISMTVPPTLNNFAKERYGFYFFILENLTDNKDFSDIKSLITDTEFNSSFFDERTEDHGIDAVYIDEDNSVINLYNFKYREKYNPDKKQSINETILSTKFINSLLTEKTQALNGKIKNYADQIIERINSREVWKINLYVVSNENVELDKNDPNLKQLEEHYDLEIIPIGLSKIKELMSIRPESIDAKLILDKDAIMSYSESSIASTTSYIIRLDLNELIRITCSDKDMRNKYNIEDIKELSSAELDFSVLFDNVRGLILKSPFNRNISKTIKEEPSKFFMYNNGITITSETVNADVINAGKKVKLSLDGFQVLNGGQTLRTIHNFNKVDAENIVSYLSKAQVLIRIFNTHDPMLKNKIAEYTNSQNAISVIDLKSLSPEQIQLEQYLDNFDIVYSRKNGDTGLSEKKIYAYKVSMEKFGQMLFALKGFPEKASNQKKQIFDKYYDQLFGESELAINESPNQIKEYFEIKRIYESYEGVKSSDQKVLYILYLRKHLAHSINEIIDLFEKYLSEYETETEISDARKLIQAKFKTYLDDKFKIQ